MGSQYVHIHTCLIQLGHFSLLDSIVEGNWHVNICGVKFDSAGAVTGTVGTEIGDRPYCDARIGRVVVESNVHTVAMGACRGAVTGGDP